MQASEPKFMRNFEQSLPGEKGIVSGSRKCEGAIMTVAGARINLKKAPSGKQYNNRRLGGSGIGGGGVSG